MGSNQHLSILESSLCFSASLAEVWLGISKASGQNFRKILIFSNLLVSNSPSKLKSVIQHFGVQLHKVARTAMEIERKIFHLTGQIQDIFFFS
jgi:hypothetical protein